MPRGELPETRRGRATSRDRQQRRIFVLDTNVLMHDPTSIFRFDEHDIYIPMIVLEELDAGKKGLSEAARNVRQVSRFLDELMASATKAQIDRGLELPTAKYTNGGKTWKLADAAGKNVVLYFYPKDNTTGCTLEGQAFRDLHAQFKKAGTIVLGVSPDSLASHDKFKDKMDFPFELLSDEDKKVCELFDVWKEKSMYGRKYMGVERSTFLIDAGGVLRQEWRKVKVPGHADAVLAEAQAL